MSVNFSAAATSVSMQIRNFMTQAHPSLPVSKGQFLMVISISCVASLYLGYYCAQLADGKPEDRDLSKRQIDTQVNKA